MTPIFQYKIKDFEGTKNKFQMSTKLKYSIIGQYFVLKEDDDHNTRFVEYHCSNNNKLKPCFQLHHMLYSIDTPTLILLSKVGNDDCIKLPSVLKLGFDVAVSNLNEDSRKIKINDIINL